MQTRRTLLQTALTAGAAALAVPYMLRATPLGLPLGIQLYSVRDYLGKDFVGTLKQLGALGYRQVEAAGFYDHTPAQVKDAMQQAGLSCVSAHYPSAQLYPKIDAHFYTDSAGLQ